MKRIILSTALAALSLVPFASARADTNYPYQGRMNYTVDGTVRQVDSDHQRVTIAGNDGAQYTLDTSDSDIILPSGNSAGRLSDLSDGQSVHVIGTLLDGNLVEADRLSVLAPGDPPFPVKDAHVDYEHISLPNSGGAAAGPVSLDGLVRDVDSSNDRMTIVDGDDNRYTIDMYDSDIILGDSARSGHCSDIARGMHIHVTGTRLSSGIIAADRLRVLTDGEVVGLAQPAPMAPPVAVAPPAPIAAPVADPPAPVIATAADPLHSAPPTTSYTPADLPSVDLSSYTGILIDCRNQPNILRSPSPAICGPSMELLYPDRSHVPSPDEVQDESIVRYYRTLDDAEAGVAGSNPLILQAACVVGPAQDSVELSAQDMALFQALDKKLHYLRNWKVGFLIPPDK